MKYILKAITTNNRDLRTAILLVTDEYQFLFNCPDGFQRSALIQKVRFLKIKHVFLSQLSPDFFGGLPGFYLSARESQATDLANFKINIYGPKGLYKALGMARTFIGPLNFIKTNEYGKIVKPQQLENPNQEEEKVPQTTKQQFTQSMIFEDPLLKVQVVELRSTDLKEKKCYSFIGIPKPQNQAFLPQVAKNLGVDVKDFKTLNEGNNVTLQNGTIIEPHQVKGPSIPSQCFILIFMPSITYLPSLLSNETDFAPFYFSNIDNSKQEIQVVYHSVPLEVVLNDHYKHFMRQFGPNIKHVIDCGETNDEIVGRGKGFQLSERQKLVCPHMIPLSPLALKKYAQQSKDLLTKELAELNYVNAKMGLGVNLAPKKIAGQLDESDLLMNHHQDMDKEFAIRQELKMLIDALKEKLTLSGEYPKQQVDNMNSDFDHEHQILFLGTVSMKPCQYRAASAIMLMLKGKSILMDSAEGSYGQIYDHFQDKAMVDKVILDLRCVYITHIHGDHQLGIIKIMSERDKLHTQQDNSNKLYIVAPFIMMEWLNYFKNTHLKYPDMVTIIPSNLFNPEPQLYYQNEDTDRFLEDKEKEEQKKKMKMRPECKEKTFEEANKALQDLEISDLRAKEMLEVLDKELGIKQIYSIETDHCAESYGCLLLGPQFGRIFYSGDTSPCQNVLNYARNVNYLIHEATFEESLEYDAFHKKHTTTAQAIDIAIKTKAYRTILTHFSPRYQKMAEVTDRHFESKIMVAFDHMRLKLSYLEWAYQLLKIYNKVFTNDDEFDQMPGQKSAKPSESKRQKRS